MLLLKKSSANQAAVILSFQKHQPAITFTALKKLVIILLIGLYGLSASGMAVQLHYCCGKVAGISLGYSASKKASCKHGMKMTMPGCCNDQQINMHVDNNQGLASDIVVPAPLDIDVPELIIVYTATVLSENRKTVANIRGSPPLSAVPIYLLNQVFRN